jgi:putative transposase
MPTAHEIPDTPRIPDVVLDQLLSGADPKTVFDPNGLLDDLKKALAGGFS